MQAYGGRFDSSIEIGHTYVPDTLTPFTGEWRIEDTAELPIFRHTGEYHANIVATALAHSARPLLIALIDDVGCQADEAFFTELSVIESLDEIQDVYYESTYVDRANALVDRLRTARLPDGWRLSSDGRKLIAGKGRTKMRLPLVGFSAVSDDPEHPSCQLLDAAWMLDRLESIAPKAATILPEAFRDQQQQVATVATLLSDFEGANITSIFTDSTGIETDRFVWPLAS